MRPWHFITQPALRCIPDAERVARLVAEAAETRLSRPKITPVAAPPPLPPSKEAPMHPAQPLPSAKAPDSIQRGSCAACSPWSSWPCC